MSKKADCLHPDFPVVTGKYQLTSTWSVDLPLKFNRRIEDGSLILWRPGITVYLIAWGNDHNESVETRLAQLKSEISPDAFEPREKQTSAETHFSYRLVENGVNGLYGFVVTGSGYMQVAIYFDDESDIDIARAIFDSLTEDGV